MSYIHARGIRHHVQILGEGSTTVVFLHGLVMDNLSSWYFTAATRVASTCRAVLMDLRGHGRTDRPDHGYAVDDFIADVIGVLDALDVRDPVVLVGNSFGGQLAAALAVAHPDRVRGLVLVDAHLGRDGWGDQMAATLSLTGEDRDGAIATHFASWLGRHSERKRTRLADHASALVEGTSLIADLQASPPLDDASLARIACPVVALYGSDSDVLDEAWRLQDHVPHAQVRTFDGASHSLLWERTDDVVAAIVDAVQAIG